MISIKLDKVALDFIKTYPGDILWLDFQESCGTIDLSDEDKRKFFSGKASYVRENQSDSRAS